MSNGKRGRPRDEYADKVCDALKEKYPKFSRSLLSVVRNPEYGLQMAPGAISVLRDNGIPPPKKNGSNLSKKIPQRNKNNKLTVRLNDTQKVRFSEAMKASGCKSVQEYLEKIITESLKGE